MKFSLYKIIVFICIVLIAGLVVRNQLQVNAKFARQEKERLIQEQKPVFTVKLINVLGSSIPTHSITENIEGKI